MRQKIVSSILSISHFTKKYTNFRFRNKTGTFLTLFRKYLQKMRKPRKIKRISRNTKNVHFARVDNSMVEYSAFNRLVPGSSPGQLIKYLGDRKIVFKGRKS